MIFATVGTNEAPFDRLVTALGSLGVDEELVIQCGASAVRPQGARCVEFIPFDELVAHIRAARVVVMHAGVGSIGVALANGKKPVVVPRLRRFGEAVDDHQVAFARRFREQGLVHVVEDPTRLASALQNGDLAVDAAAPAPETLAADIRRFISAVVTPA
jgi:UDP-N-acetylglucosamine transferase subunit ALG13